MRSIVLGILGAAALCAPAIAAEPLAIEATYLRRAVDTGPVLSNLAPIPEDEGVAGAQLGRDDNATSGKFLGVDFTLEVVDVEDGADYAAASADATLILADAPAADLLALADARPDALIFNVSARDDALRNADCRANLLHTIPSRQMLADALAQFSAARKWREWLLVEGPRPGDAAYAQALRRAAKKFGLKIVDDRTWTFDADMRRAVAQEGPLFTQARSYDMVAVADEPNDFGRYLGYNTWLPRPLAGTAGLTPAAWGPAMEQWGAAQLQSRFTRLSGRAMTEKDYAAWAAMRAIGEAATRTKTAAAAELRRFVMAPAFELAAFKGRKQSFRAWNGQMRQPIPLLHEQAMAAQAPLEGFLHQRTDLDTLGYDAPDSACHAFEGQ